MSPVTYADVATVWPPSARVVTYADRTGAGRGLKGLKPFKGKGGTVSTGQREVNGEP